MKKALNIIFVILVMGVIVIGLITAITSKKEANEYENRPAEKFSVLTLKSYLEGDFQDSVDKTLSDRVNFAEDMKKLYNDMNSAFLKSMLNVFAPEEGKKYIKIGDKHLFDDYLVFSPSIYEYIEGLTVKRAEEYNKLIKENPDTDFYVYYIEKDTDINFETGEKLGLFELLKSVVKLPEENVKAFTINSIEDFKKYFFRTDHHWNSDGAHKGYMELAELLKARGEQIQKGSKVMVTDAFSGSKATGDAAGYSEEFYAYRYTFPEMAVTMNGYEFPDYGSREEYMAGEKTEKLTYATFYGPDEGVVVLDTKNEDRENLLIIGESYDNAVLKLIATHFNKTHAVDLRGYKLLYEDFSLRNYIKENDIDKVLFMGNIDYIILEAFIVEE